MKIYFLLLTFCITTIAFAQNDPQPSASKERLESIIKREQIDKNNILQNIKFRNIGPTIMSGRVTDLEVDPSDPKHFFVSYATGGLWETKNNGLSYKSLFDNEACMTIGAISVDWKNPGTIWLGSGEANAFTWAGLGVFKSTDNGKSWKHMGLEETQHINQVIIHPDNPDIVWIAAAGRLYSNNDERGVYKTTDGGMSWKRTLFVNDSTGVTDLIIDPENPDILYAASWERWRKSWLRHKGGKGSGIFKSIDGGETWARLNIEGSGFPITNGVGRIGLTIFPGNTNILYATVDNQDKYEKDEDEETDKLKKDIFENMSEETFTALDDEKLSEFLKENDFPEKYTAAEVKKLVKEGKIKPVALYEYLVDPTDPEEDDRPIYGAEIYRSNNAGKTWFRTHKDNLDGLFYSYGYVFDIIRVSPNNLDKIYIAGVPILVSEDGGKTFTNINEDNVHVDHHALWINPLNDNHIINGNDGGVNISYDAGKHWYKSSPEAVSQCYAVDYDMAEPYNVYTGMQDNGTWVGPSTNKNNVSWQQEGKYPYESIMGGDGFQVQVDFRDNDIIYLGYQYGNYYRFTKSKNDYKFLKIKHDLGERPLRWNWETPILLSHHNRDILYIGSNRLYRSLDKGETFKPISPDLSKGGRIGGVKYGTITTISESPLTFGLIYIGTDDGNVYLTKDGGVKWKLINKGLPENLWVSRVEASSHEDGVVYVSMNGLKWDNYGSYLFVSTDFGDTWNEIGTDLPEDMVNVVREDPVNENIIYVGTQIGVYVSLDKGKSFLKMDNGIPNVAVFDLKVHPRDKELIVGTHGRSIYIANVKHLQQLTEDFRKESLNVFEIEEVKYNSGWGDKYSPWDKPEETRVEIPYYSQETCKVKISVIAGDDLELYQFFDDAERGVNYAEYNLEISNKIIDDYKRYLNRNSEKEVKLKKKQNGKYYLQAGEYKVVISANDQIKETKLAIK